MTITSEARVARVVAQPPQAFPISDLTDEAMASVVAQNAKAWRQDYEARFAAMVAELTADAHVEPLT